MYLIKKLESNSFPIQILLNATSHENCIVKINIKNILV